MSNDWNEYAEHHTGIEIDRLLHYGHVIPVGRGLTREYVAKRFPGWTWNRLIKIWQAAGIVANPSSAGPLACDPNVKAIHFNGPDSFAVEWIDGTVTTQSDD